MFRSAVEPSTQVLIEDLVERYRAEVLNYARRLTRGDADWAEDVVQETFVRAWRHHKYLTPEYGSVHGWLIRVAHNLVMDGYRSARMRHGERPLDDADEIALPESTDQILSAQMVRDALDLIPERHRQALEVTYLLDQTAAQAALLLDVPVGTVKSRVFNGLRMLRSVMQPNMTAAA